jgi:Plavaka transposase
MHLSLFGFHITNSWTKIVDKLCLSYHSVKALHDVIDNELPGRPPFQCKELVIGDERLDFYCRDVLECIRSLYGDPNFAQAMAFAPEHHYTSSVRTSHIYNELYTGDW